MMGNDPDVIARLLAAGERHRREGVGAPLWDDEYKRAIRSEIADMKNSGARGQLHRGGMFFKQFARKAPWAHLDIAGMAWTDGDRRYKPAPPATGCVSWPSSLRPRRG